MSKVQLPRFKEMYELRKKGKTYTEIGIIYRVSSEAVRLVLKRHFPIIKRVVHKKVFKKKCLVCKNTFNFYRSPKKPTAKFCSFNCRRGFTLDGIKIEEENKTIRNNTKMKKYYHTKEGNKNIRKNLRNSYFKFKHKALARAKLNNAVKNGLIKKPNICIYCKSEVKRIQAHHPDYTKPLDVQWVCGVCHYTLHLKQKTL